MSKVAIIILVVFLSISSLVVSLPRHLNPHEVSEELPSSVELLTVYSLIINAACGENFTLALRDIQGLNHIYVPETLRYIYSRFNELLDREIRILNQTKVSLDNAEIALSKGLLEDAKRELKTASSLLSEADLIHNDLLEACREFSKAFGISLYQLSKKMDMLKELIEEYRARLRNLLLELERLEGSIILDTILTLYVNTSEVFVGSELFLFGTLIAENGLPLSERIIIVYLDGQKIASFMTNDMGFFSGIIKIPYIYKPTVLMFADYVPEAGDRGRFRSSRSNVIVLRLKYEVPLIVAWLNTSEVRPSEAFEVYGQIVNLKGVIKTAYVSFLGMNFEINVLEDGNFKTILRVPDEAQIGRHKVTVYTRPHGIIAPASKSLEITIYKVNTSLLVEVPRIVLGCGQIHVCGRVVVEGTDVNMPISGVVMLEAFDRILRTMIENGDFSFNMTVPCYVPNGYTTLRITFIPNSPIYEAVGVVEQVLVINPLTILLPAPIIVYLTVIGIGSLIKRMKVEGITVSEAVAVEKTKSLLISEKNGVVEITRIYLNAVRAIENSVGIKKRPSDTIREFLDRVGVFLGGAALAFVELSYMTETAIYGGVEPDLELARHLYDQILRWLA